MIRSGCIILALIVVLVPVSARGQLSSNASDPIEITADTALEWQRDKHIYIARGDAQVKQGDLLLKGEIIVAHYRDQDGKTEIWRIEAENNVVLSSSNRTAHGDKLIYTLDTGIATLTGDHLKIITPTDMITARDKIEYFDQDQKLTAVGDARAVREQDAIEADRLTAWLTQRGEQQDISRIDADGNVIITTPQDIVRGTRGSYDTKAGIAKLFGGVTIHRGRDELQGEWAQVDLNTGLSQLFAAEAQDGQPGRVRGVFYPKGSKNDQK